MEFHGLVRWEVRARYGYVSLLEAKVIALQMPGFCKGQLRD